MNDVIKRNKTNKKILLEQKILVLNLNCIVALKKVDQLCVFDKARRVRRKTFRYCAVQQINLYIVPVYF
jgi:hypothetical protein